MELTKTQKIAREVIRRTGRGNAVFNDRLVDGARSLKVWGWMKQDYELAKLLLESEGCKVYTHQFRTPFWGRGERVRLHIEENPST